MKQKYMRNYLTERLTKSELELVNAMPHKLEDVLRHERGRIMRKLADISFFWGIGSSTKWGMVKRGIYKTFVHRFLKKSDQPPVPLPPPLENS